MRMDSSNFSALARFDLPLKQLLCWTGRVFFMIESRGWVITQPHKRQYRHRDYYWNNIQQMVARHYTKILAAQPASGADRLITSNKGR